VRIVGGEHRMGETGTLIEDNGTGTPFKVKFSDSNTKWFAAEKVALAGPANKPPSGLKLEGGSLSGEAAKYLGTYRLVVGKLVNGRPVWQHASDGNRWIAHDTTSWMGQTESALGQQAGSVDLPDAAAANPTASTKTWKARLVTGWAEVPQLKCTAWTPTPPPGLKLKLEGGSLPDGYAAGYPGTYRLVGSKLVNDRPAYQHTSDATRWIAFAGDDWIGQLESSLGQKSGYLKLRDSDAASPDVSAKPWTAWTGSDWVEVPQLKCTAWTPPPPPGLKLEVEAGPPSFEVLSAQSQTEEGGCVLRGEAGAGPAFNIAAAGGTGVWSFKIIRTYAQTGLFAYVGVASASFSAAHGGAAYMFDLFSGFIWSTKNAHEQGTDKFVLQTSDVLKGKTDGALVEMRVREAGGKRYLAFRVNTGSWNEVVADSLPGVVRPYARCGYSADRIRLEKAPAIKAGAGSLPGDAAKYPGTYRLTSKLVNGRPAYQHMSNATRWIAFDGDSWMGQLESSLGKGSGNLWLKDSTAASPDVSTKTWKAIGGAGAGWVEAPQLKCTAWTFKLNERVECRDNGSDWKVGRVTSVTPLMVQLDGYPRASTWDEVRALESGV
jgi:hypothetical protein